MVLLRKRCLSDIWRNRYNVVNMLWNLQGFLEDLMHSEELCTGGCIPSPCGSVRSSNLAWILVWILSDCNYYNLHSLIEKKILFFSMKAYSSTVGPQRSLSL